MFGESIEVFMNYQLNQENISYAENTMGYLVFFLVSISFLNAFLSLKKINNNLIFFFFF